MTLEDLQLYEEYFLTLVGEEEKRPAILVIMSQNRKSLAFNLNEEIAVRIPAGLAITKSLPILVDESGRFMDLWGREWHVMRERKP